eukprot:scaffold53_cov193-Pinguiococcus_pyrenoidosus.AAC.51
MQERWTPRNLPSGAASDPTHESGPFTYLVRQLRDASEANGHADQQRESQMHRSQQPHATSCTAERLSAKSPQKEDITSADGWTRMSIRHTAAVSESVPAFSSASDSFCHSFAKNRCPSQLRPNAQNKRRAEPRNQETKKPRNPEIQKPKKRNEGRRQNRQGVPVFVLFTPVSHFQDT